MIGKADSNPKLSKHESVCGKNEKMETINDRHHRCFFGWVHVSTTIRLVIAYFLIYNICIGFLRLPPISVYIAIIGIATCLFSLYHVIRKNPRFLVIFYFYVVFTIFYLLFLGGYFFFINIFNKDLVKQAIGTNSDIISFLWHFMDVILMLTHAWALGVISKTRKYYTWLAEGGQKVELTTTTTTTSTSLPSPRHESKPDIF
ncbi:unnamed protein product [Caenorhabditis angaria]|uniref:Uncharacterized protein n=1 Tax=Caenorhabditis angaria TaxID=860376 RepID=A0A9P1IRC3_9PELO|nr:unnamed protein product [Caenorhabditis angaria]